MTKGGIALRGVGAKSPTSRRLRSIFLDKIDQIPSFEIRYSIFDILWFAVYPRPGYRSGRFHPKGGIDLASLLWGVL